MSTPMYALPEHFPMPINKDGNGPAEHGTVHEYHCWCDDPKCERYTITAEQMQQAIDFLTTKSIGWTKFIAEDGYASVAGHSNEEIARLAVEWIVYADWKPSDH